MVRTLVFFDPDTPYFGLQLEFRRGILAHCALNTSADELLPSLDSPDIEITRHGPYIAFRINLEATVGGKRQGNVAHIAPYVATHAFA